MRQTKLTEFANGSRPNGRITRTCSDLPKEQPKEEEVQESQSEEDQSQSSQPPKEKKIHHMTLKAMERKKKLAEAAQLLGIDLNNKPEPVQKVRRKRGRPKSIHPKKIEEKQDYEIKEVSQMIAQPEKKQISLRKRDNNKRFVEQDSQAIEKQIEEIKEKSVEAKPIEVQVKLPLQKPEELPAVHVPKKRGRKKKIQPESLVPTQLAASSVQKIFTIPKTQTYDNYLKFYDRLIEQTKQGNNLDIPLIFDKFQHPLEYKKLLTLIK